MIKKYYFPKRKNGELKIEKINFRNSFFYEMMKLTKACSVDISIPLNGVIASIRSTPQLTEKELNKYIKFLNEYFEVEVMDVKKWDKEYDENEFPKQPIYQKGDKVLLKLICIKDEKTFPINKEQNKNIVAIIIGKCKKEPYHNLSY